SCWICIVVTVLGLMLGLGVAQEGKQRVEVYKWVPISLDREGKIKPPAPKWVTTKWEGSADAAFLPVLLECEPELVFKGFDNTGKWGAKTRAAFKAWRGDCQSAVKLFTVCRYMQVAREVDTKFRGSQESRDMLTELNIGWEILRSAPKSYEFMRMWYRCNAGDGDFHQFGDMAKLLLARNPADRGVAIAVAAELWDIRPNVSLEALALSSLQRAKETKYWRPWDDLHLSKVYLTRAARTKKRSDLALAVKHNETAFKNAPVGYDKTHIIKNREVLKDAASVMKYP
ncbi:MAG: hypothetical protein ABL962_20705, partial [Fimbriimonadaceae bacterium]